MFQRFNPTLKETLCKSVLQGSKKKMNINIYKLYWIDMTEPLYIFVFQRFNPTLKETLCKSVFQGSQKKNEYEYIHIISDIIDFQRFNPNLKETLCKSVVQGSKKK